MTPSLARQAEATTELTADLLAWSNTVRRAARESTAAQQHAGGRSARLTAAALRLTAAVDSATFGLDEAQRQCQAADDALSRRAETVRRAHADLVAASHEAATARWAWEATEASHASREAQLTAELALMRRLASEERGVNVWPTPASVASLAEQLRRAELGRLAAADAVAITAAAEDAAATGFEQLRPGLAVAAIAADTIGTILHRISEQRDILHELARHVIELQVEAETAAAACAEAASAHAEVLACAAGAQIAAADCASTLADLVESRERAR